jgi:hypothetical protein
LHVRWSTALSAERKAGGIPILHDAIKHVLADKSLKDNKGKPLDWEIPARTWTTVHELALVDAVVHFTGVHGKSKQVDSVSNARFWPLRAAKGKLVTKRIKVDKVTGQEIKGRDTENTEEKLVPVFLEGQSTGWIPKTANPIDYGPKEDQGSFKRYE